MCCDRFEVVRERRLTKQRGGKEEAIDQVVGAAAGFLASSGVCGLGRHFLVSTCVLSGCRPVNDIYRWTTRKRARGRPASTR